MPKFMLKNISKKEEGRLRYDLANIAKEWPELVHCSPDAFLEKIVNYQDQYPDLDVNAFYAQLPQDFIEDNAPYLMHYRFDPEVVAEFISPERLFKIMEVAHEATAHLSPALLMRKWKDLDPLTTFDRYDSIFGFDLVMATWFMKRGIPGDYIARRLMARGEYGYMSFEDYEDPHWLSDFIIKYIDNIDDAVMVAEPDFIFHHSQRLLQRGADPNLILRRMSLDARWFNTYEGISSWDLISIFNYGGDPKIIEDRIRKGEATDSLREIKLALRASKIFSEQFPTP